MTSADPGTYRAILLDIEGTTTSISFVYEVLFPYARAEAENYLRSHWGEEDLRSVLELFRDLVDQDQAGAMDDVGVIAADDEGEDAVIQSWVANIHWQMDSDRKTTALKALQGRIWKSGYVDGTLKGQVYPDVPIAFKAWKEAGIPVYIYSSGSVAAQKLLFGGSTHGDLCIYLSGYFDTTSGHKREANSYQAISDAIGVRPQEMLFVTDVWEEAEAAAVAQVVPVLSVRPGNKPLPKHIFREIRSLNELY